MHNFVYKILKSSTLIIFIITSVLIVSDKGLSYENEGLDTGTVKGLSPAAVMGPKAEIKYDIQFYQSPLRDSIQFLCWIGGVNVIIPEDVVGTTTVNFRDISVRDALTSIVKANSLEYTIEGDVVRIGSRESFRDSGEDLQSETFRLRFAVATEMQPKIEKLLSSRGSALSDERTNSLIVREIPSNLGNVRRMIADVDIKDAQVLIEAKILEATRSFSRDLGIQWGLNSSGNRVNVTGLTGVGAADNGSPLNVNMGAGSPTSGIGLLIGQLAGNTNIDVQISAAERRGDVYVISDPSIVTSNGNAAHIRSGDTLLIQSTGDINIGTPGGTQSAGSAGLQQIKTGIELNVTPQISVGDLVKLEIEAVTSQPDFSRAIQGIPVVVDNTATTTVLVKDGETTVIGGLSRFSDTLTKRNVPFFSKIPLVGNLFKSKNRIKGNSELMIFIKPTIVRNDTKLPAQTQARIKEIEERHQNMELQPMLSAEDEKVKGEVPLIKRSNSYRPCRGNKYTKTY